METWSGQANVSFLRGIYTESGGSQNVVLDRQHQHRWKLVRNANSQALLGARNQVGCGVGGVLVGRPSSAGRSGPQAPGVVLTRVHAGDSDSLR